MTWHLKMLIGCEIILLKFFPLQSRRSIRKYMCVNPIKTIQSAVRAVTSLPSLPPPGRTFRQEINWSSAWAQSAKISRPTSKLEGKK